MARNPVGAVILYPIGVVLTGGAVIVLGWVAWAVYDVEAAYAGALWVLKHPDMPLRLNWTPEQLATAMTGRNGLLGEAALGALLLLIGGGTLGAARTQSRPANQSHDGKFEIVLKTPQPRAGTTLDGSLRVLGDVNPGQVYRLDFSCKRNDSDDDGKSKEDMAFFLSQDVKAVQGAQGSSVPFSISIPATAPESEGLDGWIWRLNVYRANALVATGSDFDLTLGPATAAERRAFDEAQPAPLRAAIDAINSRRAVEQMEPLQPHELERLRKMSPEQLVLVTPKPLKEIS